MARRSTVGRLIIIWFLLESVFSVPSPESLSLKSENVNFTTKITNTIEDTSTTKASLRTENLELKTSSTTSTTTPRPSPDKPPLYRLDGSNGQACVLLQVDALVAVKYRNKLGENLEANIYVPYNATVTGNCENENLITMSLKWTSFALTWHFAKTPGGERWYVNKIELTYNSSDRHFQNNEQPNKTIRLRTSPKHSSMLFPTPVGKSYVCEEEKQIELEDGKNYATVMLRGMKLQPFKFKNNEFAAEFSCNALSARAERDETAPVAVGSTLAVAVLLTITGYAGYRYFKVKKVKYDTME